MAPRNKGMPPNRVDDVSTEDASVTEGNTEPEVSAEEAWAAAEGYTPLAEIRSEGAVFMAFPPDSEDEDVGTSFSGAFFADMDAFGPPVESPSDEWGGQRDANDEQDGGGAHDRNDMTENVDFRSVADQALRALDDEYEMTLQGTVSPPSTENKASASARADQKVGAVVSAPSTSVSEPMFKDTLSETKATSYLEEKETPMIDTDAVRKAVDSIRLKHPRLTKNLNEWEEQHGVNDTSVVALAPREHAIIPKSPLSAFWRQSSKAISATANLSRSATLAEAIDRLSCLNSERLVIHVVGADHVECSSDDQQQTYFGPLVRWIGALEKSPRHIDICLVGPNVPADAPNRPPLDLMPNTSSRLVSATASCYEGVYHEWIQQQQENGNSSLCPADIVIAFNAGLWGYDQWNATIKALCESSVAVPFISTAYTIQECEDDAEVIENVASLSTAKATLLWKAEANPFSSRQIRETKTAVSGREYRENAAWQAWKLGGSSDSG